MHYGQDISWKYSRYKAQFPRHNWAIKQRGLSWVNQRDPLFILLLLNCLSHLNLFCRYRCFFQSYFFNLRCLFVRRSNPETIDHRMIWKGELGVLFRPFQFDFEPSLSNGFNRCVRLWHRSLGLLLILLFKALQLAWYSLLLFWHNSVGSETCCDSHTPHHYYNPSLSWMDPITLIVELARDGAFWALWTRLVSLGYWS